MSHRAGQSPRAASVVARNWKLWGPSASHSDGDAEYYALTNRLQAQYQLFDPQPTDLDQEPQQELGVASSPSLHPERPGAARTRPEFGLTPRQIAALGLSGSRLTTPDPVRRDQWPCSANDPHNLQPAATCSLPRPCTLLHR